MGVDKAWELRYRRCGFRYGLCYLEVGDLGKSSYLRIIFHCCHIGVIMRY